MLVRYLATLRHWLNMLVYSWRALGPRVIARNLVRFSLDPEARNVDTGFDARFGTDTTRGLTPGEAAIPSERCASATMYIPTVDADLAAMLEALRWPEALIRRTTFVDVGSGKGRVVMLAAMRPFREVVGVELSPVLDRIARTNLAIVQPALTAPARLTLGDATTLDVPRGPLILYLYHPFRDAVAAQMIARVLASLEEDPRPAAILYGHPTLQRCIEPDVFTELDVFRLATAGARSTRRFRIGWTVWTNQAWLELAHGKATSQLAAAAS